LTKGDIILHHLVKCFL